MIPRVFAITCIMLFVAFIFSMVTRSPQPLSPASLVIGAVVGIIVVIRWGR